MEGSAASLQRPESLIGTKLDVGGEEFEILSLLGAGNDGIVYRARSVDGKHPDVAIKIFRSPLVDYEEMNPDELAEMGIDALVREYSGLAEALFDKVLAADPAHTLALHNRGVALLHQDRFEEALACFEKVLEQDPNDAGALYNKGYILRDFKDEFQGSVRLLWQDHRVGWR